MTWLIRLYPPAWRRRYGRELAELIASQPASFGMAIDLVAGAVDAWLNPQSVTSRGAAAAADAKGAGVMVSKMLQLKCTGDGPIVTTADNVKAAAIVIVGSLVTALAYTAYTWTRAEYARNSYLDGLVSVSWLVLFVFSQHYTTLKGRPGVVQAVLIGGEATLVIGIVLAAAWFNSN